MSQFENLKSLLLSARKERNQVKVSLYSYLLGVLAQKVKSPSDEDFYAGLKSYIKSTSEHAASLSPEAKATHDIEIALVYDLLPKQLTIEQIEVMVTAILTSNVDAKKNFGLVMKPFKESYNGQFNPGDIRAAWEHLKD